MHYPDHTASPTPCQATTRPPPARSGAWLLACALGLTLTACGGSSDDNSSADNSGSGSNNSANNTQGNSVFIAASGPLCAQRSSQSGNCIQPTSSAIDEAGLVQAIIDPDPQKPLIDFDSMGFLHNTTFTHGTGTKPTGSIIFDSYGMARRAVQVGRNTFTVQDRSYPLATNQPQAGRITYSNAQGTGSVSFSIGNPEDHKEGYWGTTFTENQTIGPATISDTSRRNSNWFSDLRLLTDQADAPREQTVTYVGTINPISGTGERLNEHTLGLLSTGVHYEAEFNTATGKLTGVRIDHTDPGSQRRTVLEIPELQFMNSQLVPASRSHRMRIQLEGPGEDSRMSSTSDNGSPGAPLPDTARMQADFTLDGLEGEITGKQAEAIQIIGGGPKGSMQLVLMRKDRLGEDVPPYIPLQR